MTLNCKCWDLDETKFSSVLLWRLQPDTVAVITVHLTLVLQQNPPKTEQRLQEREDGRMNENTSPRKQRTLSCSSHPADLTLTVNT